MKCLSLLVFTVFLVSCSQVETDGLIANPSTTTSAIYRAIYLVQNHGQLDTNDLRAHPQVLVTSNFSDLEQYARGKVALWIDKSATTLMMGNWLDQPPQMYYPIVLVGYNNPLYSFKYVLHICCFSGPADPHWDTTVLEPGFSIIQREGANGSLSGVGFVQGYAQMPQVQDILNITNPLLDGTFKPTATPIITLSTPTPPAKW